MTAKTLLKVDGIFGWDDGYLYANVPKSFIELVVSPEHIWGGAVEVNYLTDNCVDTVTVEYKRVVFDVPAGLIKHIDIKE